MSRKQMVLTTDPQFPQRLVFELLCHALRTFGIEARAGRQLLRVEVADDRHHLGATVQSKALKVLGVEPTRDLPRPSDGDEVARRVDQRDIALFRLDDELVAIRAM